MEGWRQLSSICLGEDASSRCSLYSWTLIAPSGEEVEHIGIGLKAKQCEDSADASWPSSKSPHSGANCKSSGEEPWLLAAPGSQSRHRCT